MLVLAAGWASGCEQSPRSRLDRIRQRGVLVCGIKPGIAGFATADANGRYDGLDIDICRAVAGAILQDVDHVRFIPVASLDDLDRLPEIDLVSRRLTVSLRREGMGVLFGPIMFYDGQSFLVKADSPYNRPADLAGHPICVYQGSEHDITLTSFFKTAGWQFERIAVADGAAASAALLSGICDAFSTDVTELASVRSTVLQPEAVRILPDSISREPLAQLVRAVDVDLLTVLRWTVFAMISAEELGVTSKNVDVMAASSDPEVRRLLGVTPGNGAAIGLDEAWATKVIRGVGNYGEAFNRHVGPDTRIGLERGLNDLWSRGGLMFAPPLR